MRKHPNIISDNFSTLGNIKKPSWPTFGQKNIKNLHFPASEISSKFQLQSIFYRFRQMDVHYFVDWPN
eukprot:UN20770